MHLSNTFLLKIRSLYQQQQQFVTYVKWQTIKEILRLIGFNTVTFHTQAYYPKQSAIAFFVTLQTCAA
jgi:uncharacterized membrane protein YjfL (UPF0719 family)